MFKDLLANGMAYNDIMDADYYHLMEIFGTKERQPKKEIIDLADFVESLEKKGGI